MMEEPDITREMSREDLAEMTALLGAQKDYFVFKIMRRMLTEEWRESVFTDECKQCQEQLLDGHDILIWGEPLSDKDPKDSKHVGLANFCSEECFETYSDEWAKDHDFREYAKVFYDIG